MSLAPSSLQTTTYRSQNQSHEHMGKLNQKKKIINLSNIVTLRSNYVNHCFPFLRISNLWGIYQVTMSILIAAEKLFKKQKQNHRSGYYGGSVRKSARGRASHFVGTHSSTLSIHRKPGDMQVFGFFYLQFAVFLLAISLGRCDSLSK